MSCRGPERSIALLSLAVCALVTAAPDCSIAAPPAIVFASETCDMGSVVQGEQPDCVFSFSNAGGDDLRLLQVKPSCGCTSALLSSPLLSSGAHGSLRVAATDKKQRT